MSKHFAISWKINTYWTTEYELHDDSSVTILAHYRDGRIIPEGGLLTCKRYRLQEIADSRQTVALEIYGSSESIKGMKWQRGELTSTHPIRNPAFVFSYSKEPLIKTDSPPAEVF
jgi:hypothetical protein